MMTPGVRSNSLSGRCSNSGRWQLKKCLETYSEAIFLDHGFNGREPAVNECLTIVWKSWRELGARDSRSGGQACECTKRGYREP